MTTDLSTHASLFLLGWTAAPQQAIAAANERGISERFAIEMSAWCAELHEQLRQLAEERDMPLLLMGGHAAALRVEAAKQRGSRDNDYLTTASEADIVALMDALQAKFADHFPEPLFRYRRLLGGKGAELLPLAAFAVDVPALLNANNDTLAVKVEFHIESDSALFPEEESVTGAFYGLAEDVTARLPRLPYQVALKLMTLHEPPVGLLAKYEAAFPRQMWDVDVLVAQMADQEQFRTLAEYGPRRYVKEEVQRHRKPQEGGPWAGIQRRLNSWAPLTEPQWVSIEQFQSSQMTRATRRPRDQWTARVARLRLLSRLLADDDYATWNRMLAAEKRIPDRPQGAEVKQTRNRVAGVTGAPPKSLGQYPRRAFWEHLAHAKDLDAALSAFETALI
jgi:hypothetical protein